MNNPSQTCGIYAIVNNATGRTYIGVATTTFTRRWHNHIRDLEAGTHHNTELQQDWRDLGQVAFDFVIIESFPKSKSFYYMSLRALERKYITSADVWLYNSTKDRYSRRDDFLISFLYQ